ncbi:MAG: AAA domain-containing protein [Bacteroidetes bacterium]|jgi:DNA-binding NtrC family response regulator|nr:AAA domain-containing protein [Bacteroidota bacterium]
MDRQAIQERYGIVGSSDAIRKVIDRARMVAKTDISVLIQGESGVGKELIAEILHELSSRRHGPRIIVNCGAIPEGLIESELFGAEKGAYTGAVEKRSGYFEDADGGTIFLDEIGEMPQQAQVRLLRVLESGQFSRVGSSQQRSTDVRVIAATNKDLAKEVERGEFREDLYYRLSTVIIRIPPLRERTEDILPIFDTYMHQFTQKYDSARKALTDDARELLQRYHWPGNVRELRNVAEQAVVLMRGDTLTADDLRPQLKGPEASREKSLMPVRRKAQQEQQGPDGASEFREREMIYRALWEIRVEMRELKEEMQKLRSSSGSVAIPRKLAEQHDFSSEQGDYVIIDSSSSGSDPDDEYFEDAAYEIEQDENGVNGAPPPAPAAGRASSRSLAPSQGDAAAGRGAEPSAGAAADAPSDPDDLPTLEEAEQELIKRALRQFEGNRRQTSRALGISERTLYRKLKTIDEEDL